jgi:uncharacterized OB-fold protein/short-subunit dehydrogenase
MSSGAPSKRNPLKPARAPKPLPAQRSRAALGLAAQAAEGRFALQVCAECGAAQYPPRDACEKCLSATLEWREVSPLGTLVAVTTTRVSGELYFRERAPLRTGIVALDAGPRAVAHLVGACEAGARVRASLKLDASGRAAVVAAPVDETPDAQEMRRFSADPRHRNVLIVDGRASTATALAAAFRAAGAARVLIGVAELWRPPPAVEGEVFALDVTDAKSVETLAELIGDKVDILVNNADHFRPESQDARAIFEVHALGLTRLAAAFGPVMRARTAETGRSSAAFVNVISALALSGSTQFPAYAAAQAAARSLSLALRAESRTSGLRVVDALTGPIDDEWRQSIRPPKVAPAALASAIVAALREGLEEAVVGDVAREIHAKWAEDPRLMRQESP